MKCLEAALAADCDAVYAGCDRFGARAYAGNFSSDELIDAIDRMHIFGRKLYLTLNTLIKPDEYKELYSFMKPFYRAGLDGVIVQDLGVVSLLKNEFGDLHIHASTQMSVSSAYGAEFLRKHGISRVVTSRELSLKELCEIRAHSEVELECFIHGAMCYSYSGMCLMSSFLGGRSGNRGRCAGPCRQPYSAGGIKDSYLLSMKDLCTIDILDELINAGIASFKIEGRMKSPAYVYGVTGIYRRCIDLITENKNESYRPSGNDRKRLTDLYSRGGISEGYYNKRNDKTLITVEKGAYKRKDTGDTEIKRKRFLLKGKLRAYAGQEMVLSVEPVTRPGMDVTVTGDMVLKAERHPMTQEDFKKQLIKTGDSDFMFEGLDIDTDGCSFVRVASINGLRRRALEEIKERITNDHKRSL